MTRRGGGGCDKHKVGGGQRGGMGLDGTILSTALVPISLVLANQYWPGKMSKRGKTQKGGKRGGARKGGGRRKTGRRKGGRR